MLDSLTLWTEADIARVCRISGALLLIEDALNEDERTRIQLEMDTLLSGLITLNPVRATILCS